MIPWTSKTRAVISALFAGLFGFLNQLAVVPPSQQADWLGQLTQIVPESWKPNTALFTRFLMWFLMVYGAFQAAHSGPQTPPKNLPSQ